MKNIIKIFFTKVVNYLTNNSHIEKEHQKFLKGIDAYNTHTNEIEKF